MQNLIVQFNAPKEVFKRDAYSLKVSQLEIVKFEDLPSEKKVFAYLTTFPGRILLWEGEQYDAIGDWTTQQVIERIIEIYG